MAISLAADVPMPEVAFPRLTLRQKGLVSIGNAVDGVSTAALGNFQFFYLTVVCGLSGSLAGASVFIALTVDAVADPLIGSLSDNWASPHGRRHPIMIASILPVALSIALFFSVPVHLSASGTFGYVTAVLLLHRVSYSVFTLPYGAMVAEISHDYVERSVLRVYGAIATSASAILCLWLGYRVFLGGSSGLMQRNAYIPFGWACAVIIAVCAIVCCFGTLKLRVRMLKAAETSHSIIPRLGREIIEIFKNPSFRVIFFTALIWFIASGVFGALWLHASKFFWHLPTNVIQAVGIGLPAGSALGIPIAAFLVSRVEKRTVLCGALIFFVSYYLLLTPLRMLGILPASGPVLYSVLIGASLLNGIAVICAGIFFWSMIGDATDEHELRFGARREGLYSAGMTFSAKASLGVGTLIGGVLLDLIHFPHDATTLTTVALSREQTNELGLIVGPLIGLLLAGSIYVVWQYKLDRRTHARIVAELGDARKARAAAAGAANEHGLHT
jgi:glycoside/pentoside/hexuronide:cation symporter, GPH family